MRPRIVLSSSPMPKVWATMPKARGIICEADIRPSASSKLFAKVCVFNNNRDMRHFFAASLGMPGSVDARTLGVCASLTSVVTAGKGPTWEVDPRYFCFIGLIKKHCTHEVVLHESLHGAFAHYARINRSAPLPHPN